MTTRVDETSAESESRDEISRALEESVHVGGDEVVHHDIYTVANIITVLRLLIVPFFFSALISDNPNSDGLAFVLFTVAASTDWLDGMIARRTGTVTALGRVIDPLVDRLLIASGVLGLYMVGRLPLWVVLVLLARDVYLLWGAWELEKRHLRLAVTRLGKLTTMVLLFAFASLIWGHPVVDIPQVGSRILGEPLAYVGVAMSVTAAAHYTLRAWRVTAEPPARPGG
ncbi:MAG: CDP-diacylglycerol--glycerol-3-phosphate 3-phosphatidyltransferase [Coriobacteriia bacterium]